MHHKSELGVVDFVGKVYDNLNEMIRPQHLEVLIGLIELNAEIVGLTVFSDINCVHL